MKTILCIAIGGGIGSVLRYLITIFTNKFFQNSFPLATAITNIIGCFLIGLFFGLLEKENLVNKELKFLLITGLCGGFTTFSAFSIENVSLLQNNQFLTALLYISASIILGLLATWVGLSITK